MKRTEYTRKDVMFCIDWCINQYGVERGIPKVFLKKELLYPVDLYTGEEELLEEDVVVPFLGIYDRTYHRIEISKKLNPTLKELCSTVIHEYIHSIQPINEDKDDLMIHPNLMYEKLEYSDETDPIEHQAEYVANKDSESLRKELLLWRKSKKRK